MQENKDTEHVRRTLTYYQDLMGNSGDYIFLVTEEGKLLFTNNHFQQSLHYSEQEIENLNFISILHYVSSRAFLKLFEVISSHKNVTLRLISKLGNEIIINGNCTISKEGNEFIMKGLFHEITEEFMEKQGLERSEEKFKLLFERTLNPIVYYDPKGIIDCNKAFLDILGFSDKKELSGLVPADFSAEEQPGIEDPIRAAWKISNLALQYGSHQFEWMYRNKNGDEFFVNVSLSLIDLDARRIYFAVWSDISRRYHEEKAIKEKEVKTRSKNERLRLLNDINHLMIEEEDFLRKTKNILKSITLNLSVYSADISLLNAEMSELTSYAYSIDDTGKFYEDKKFPIKVVPGIQQLLQGDIYHNPNLAEKNSATIEKRLAERGLRSVLSIPISLNDRILGFLSIADKERNTFDEGMVGLLIDLSASLALFIDQFNMTNLNKRYGKLEESLHKLGTKILSFLNIEEISKKLYKEVNEIMDAPIFGFGLFNKQKNALEFKSIVEYGKVLPPFDFELSDEKSLGSVCFNNGMDIIVNSFEKDVFKYLDAYDRAKIPGKKPESLVYLPMIFNGEKIGVITAQSYSKNKYGDKNVFILKILANYISIAANNAQRFEANEKLLDNKTREIIMQKIKLQKTNYQQKIINSVGQIISTNNDFDSIFNDMYDQISKLMDTTIFGIRIYHPDKNAIEYNYEIESGVKVGRGFISIEDANVYSNWCFNHGKPIFINDNFKEHKKYVSETETSAEGTPESLLFQPLLLNDEKLGVITVQSYNKNAYNHAQLDMLEGLANFTCIAIKNSSVQQNGKA